MSAGSIEEPIQIPTWVVDHKSFQRWAFSDRFPERGRYSFLKGEVWIDMSPEQIYTHNQLKGAYAVTLTLMLTRTRLGRFFYDRCFLSNARAGLSTEPDGLFVSYHSMRAKRVRRIKGKVGYLGFSGSPDMVLEVVSDSSVVKDTLVLPSLYWQANIFEYWLVDGRGNQPQFTIFSHTKDGYVAVTKQAGWQKSKVFGKSFNVTVQPDELGDPEYKLLVR